MYRVKELADRKCLVGWGLFWRMYRVKEFADRKCPVGWGLF